MKSEEDYGPDRIMGIETDDEDNVAERFCHNHDDDDDDTESEVSGTSKHPSFFRSDSDHSPSWPQSYRQSMHMYTCVTPPTVSFLRGNSLLAPVDRKSETSDIESSLNVPLIGTISVDKEDVLTSTFPVKVSSASGLRISEFPTTQQCSYSQSILNAINALCGIGILSTPYALKEGGWLSILLLFMFGIITCYTGVLLKRCLESSPQIQTYPDIGQAAFGLTGRICIAVILYIELYSSCVEFLIMMSDNLSRFFPNAEVDIAGIHLNSYQICAITSTLVILPTVWLRNLSLLSYISVGGVISLILVVMCLLWVGVTGEVGFHPSDNALNLAKLPITIGIYSFCYGGHSVFPNIYSSMEEPYRFPSVLVISFAVAAFIYAGIGVCGFLMFGEASNSQFTLNLPEDSVASSIAGWTVVATPVTKFALTITPVALAVEELLPSNQLIGSTTMSILIRTVLVISTLIVALTVPYFGSVMALIGSFLITLVSIILPCACYMRLGGSNLTKLQTAACTFTIIVGVISAFIGTYSAVTSMTG